MTNLLVPKDAIGLVLGPLTGLPAALAGSSVAAEAHGLPLHPESDVDVFCYTEQSMIAGVQLLLNAGFELDDRYGRVWNRWLQYGLRSWHTNSIKLIEPNSNTLVNLVYKLMGGHPVNSLAQVLESFDFGLLAMGYDLKHGTYHDMRSYLFPDLDPNGPLPLMPNKREAWRNGFISQYNGLREPGRYAKYVSYGHDMSGVRDDLILGYEQIALYLRDRGDADKIQMAQIYETISNKIQHHKIDELLAAGKVLPQLDQLDQIMEALE